MATSLFPTSSEMSLMCAFGVFGQTTGIGQRALEITDTTAQFIELFRYNTTVGAAASGGVYSQTAAGGSSTDGHLVRVAARFKTNDFRNAVDGVLTALDPTGAMPSPLTTLRLGSHLSGNSYLNGYLRYCIVVPRAWSDAELQTVTTP